MKKVMTNEYWDRLHQWLKTLQMDFYQPLGELSFSGFTSYDSLTQEEAKNHHFSSLSADTEWGHTWEYMWLRTNFTLPEASTGEMIVLDLRFDGEATLFLNGIEFGTKRADWVKTPHHFMVDNVISQNAVAGQQYELMCEVYAGHYFPGTRTGPILPGSLSDPLQEGKRRKIRRSTFGIWNEDAYQLYLDLNTLLLLYEQQDESELWTSDLADALENATHCIEFEQSAEKRKESYQKARAYLKHFLNMQNGSRQATMYAVGNAHLDLAWLWPFEETRRKTARTFAQQLRLIDMYPAYKFVQSQPASYEMCRMFYPDLYKRICNAVKTGQWVADGAMYVEPDTNMSSGESLIRQLVYGKEFYKKEFHTDSDVLWLPDTFGYTAALPQILKSCNVHYLVTQKIFWSYNDADQFPYHYFTWKGMDGSEITSFLPTSYTYETDPQAICQAWKNRVQKRNLDSFLIPFGYGDGGGGPTRDHIEYVQREKNLQGMPKVEICSPHDFFETMEAKKVKKDTWNGELYFSAHRGTYTSQALIKKNNRKSEVLLRDLDWFSAIALVKAGKAPDYEKKKALWKTLLLNQFHDILPGSSIGKVYEEANALHASLQKEADNLIHETIASLSNASNGLSVFNTLSWPRKAIIAVDDRFAAGAITPDGQVIPVAHGKALIQLPAMGYTAIMPAQTNCTISPCTAHCNGQEYVLENEIIRVVFDSCGQMLSYEHKKNGILFSGLEMNKMLLFKDIPRSWDAWDIDSIYEKDEIPLPHDAKVEIAISSGLEAAITVNRAIENSTICQTIYIQSESDEVFFQTNVDWHERHRMLKVRFDGVIHAANALHEMQFGYVERPVFRSNAYEASRFEVCNHHYSALCDNSHGFAVLNDCKYGVGTHEGTIELTLLRAPSAPDMNADQGEHSFTYAFTAWSGAFAQSNVVRKGYELNQPIHFCQGIINAESLFSIDHPAVILETIKPSEDESGDIILRLYEATNSTVNANLHIGLPGSWYYTVCNMLEEETDSYTLVHNNTVPLTFTPFNIKTIRLKSTPADRA